MIKINTIDNYLVFFPIDESKPYIEVDEETYAKIQNNELIYQNGKLVENLHIEERIAELKQKLKDTDYQPLKYLDGEYTEEEYAVLKAQRQAWREEIRQLEEKCETNTEEKPKNKPQMIVT